MKADSKAMAVTKQYSTIENNLDLKEKAAGYLPPEMFFLNLPYKDPKVAIWTRQYSKKDLYINWHTGHNSHQITDVSGIPYGVYARLIIDYIVTYVKQTDKKVIEFGNSYKEILQTVGVQRYGGAAKKGIKEQWNRIVKCYISFVDCSDQDLEKIERVFLVDKSVQDKKNTKFYIQISDAFYDYIKNSSSIPFNNNTVKKLFNRPMAMDLYKILNYEAFLVNQFKKKRIVFFKDLQKMLGSTATYKEFSVQLKENILVLKSVESKFKIQVNINKNSSYIEVELGSNSNVLQLALFPTDTSRYLPKTNRSTLKDTSIEKDYYINEEISNLFKAT